MNTEILLPFLCEMLAKSAAILLLAALIVRVWRRASAAQQHLVWFSALGVILLLPMTRLVTPRWTVPIEPATTVSITMTSVPSIALDPSLTIAAPTAPVPAARKWRLPDWRTLVIGVWLAGSAGLLGYRLLGSWRLRRLKRNSAPLEDARVTEMHRDILRELGVRQSVDIRVSEECHVPMTWGARRPVLVLPKAALEWSDSRLASALRHEAGHISRQDYLVRWLAHLVCAVYWPNPLVWLAARALRTAQERATDDLVLRAGAPPEEYATQLFDAARTVAAHGLFARHAVTMATPSTLETRVLAIVDDRRDRRPLSRKAAALGSAGVVLTLAICAAAQLQGADAKSAQKSAAPAAAVPGNAPSQIYIQTKFLEFTPGGDMTFSNVVLPMPQDNTVYSDPQFQVVIRALNQKKGVDILSAPGVTTRSGQRATVEIIREFRYPSEWEKDGKGDWIPKGHDAKKLGVTFDVVPTLDAEGNVELKMEAKLAEFVGFIDFDSTGNEPQGADAAQNSAERLARTTVEPPPGKRVKPKFSEQGTSSTRKIRSGETIALLLDHDADAEKGAGRGASRRRTLVFVSPYVLAAAPAKAPAVSGSAEERAEKIVIPKVEFRDTSAARIIEFLQQQGRELAAEGQGVDIILHRPATELPHTSVSFEQIPLLEAVRYVAELANLPVSIERDAIIIGTPPSPGAPPAAAAASESRAMIKARSLLVPAIEFRDATIDEAVEFLRMRSRELDPEKVGVNIVLKADGVPNAKISLTLKNVPLSEALRYVAELSNLSLSADPDALVLQPKVQSATSKPRPTLTAEREGETPVSITADKTTHDQVAGEILAEGHVQIRCGPTTLTADSIRFFVKTSRAEALGKVEIHNGRDALAAKGVAVVFDKTGQFTIEGVTEAKSKTPSIQR